MYESKYSYLEIGDNPSLIAFYWNKAWRSGTPQDKKHPPLATQPPKPKYRPGTWLMFYCGPFEREFVGKILYAVLNKDRSVGYETEVAFSNFRVEEEDIKHRMIKE